MATRPTHDTLTEAPGAGTGMEQISELDETLRAVVEAAARVTGARYGAMGVLGADRRISRFITVGLSDEERERLGALPTGRGILGVLIDESRPLRLRDLSTDPRSVGFPPNHPPMCSFLGVPVEGRGGVFGNLYLTETSHGAFTDEDERVVLLLAGIAAVAIENAQLYLDAAEQADEAIRAAGVRDALMKIAGAVLQEHDLREAMRRVAGEAVGLLGVRLVAVGVPDDFEGVVRYDVASGPAAATFDLSPVPLGDSFAGSVLLAGTPIHLDGRDPLALATFPSAERFVGHDVIAQPVMIGDEPVAVLIAADRSDGAVFAFGDQELLEVVGSFAAIAVRTLRSLGRERARADAVARLRQAQIDAEAGRETLARVIETQERERRRIAQDLHDRTASGLTAILFALGRLERDVTDDDHRSTIIEAREGIVATIEDVRDLIADLRPKVLDDFGLGAALERLCETVARRSGLQIGPPVLDGLDRLPEGIATAAYRIAQEALSNVTRHSGAGRAMVDASASDERLVLTVDDDGKGFGPGTLGYGIEGMMERARMVGGRVELERSSAGGARIRFETTLASA